jgi:hypothetical protein
LFLKTIFLQFSCYFFFNFFNINQLNISNNYFNNIKLKINQFTLKSKIKLLNFLFYTSTKFKIKKFKLISFYYLFHKLKKYHYITNLVYYYLNLKKRSQISLLKKNIKTNLGGLNLKFIPINTEFKSKSLFFFNKYYNSNFIFYSILKLNTFNNFYNFY